jgi:hypothetical protein
MVGICSIRQKRKTYNRLKEHFSTHTLSWRNLIRQIHEEHVVYGVKLEHAVPEAFVQGNAECEHNYQQQGKAPNYESCISMTGVAQTSCSRSVNSGCFPDVKCIQGLSPKS